MKKISTQELANKPETEDILETASKTFSGSKKIYVEGSNPKIKVPMREVLQTSSITSKGKEKNFPIYLYDTSGPYTDPDIEIDIEAGIPKLRSSWLNQRSNHSTPVSYTHLTLPTKRIV